jgi:site-specific recombinase XerD
MTIPILPGPAPRLTSEQVDALLAAARGPSWRARRDAALLHALALGLRPAEAHRLRVRDLDVERRCLHFAGAKTGRARTVPLDALGRGDAALAAFTGHLARRGAPDPHERLVLSESGTPLRPAAQRRILRRLARRAGLGGRTCPYGLRRAAARGFADRGAPIGFVAALLGHAGVGTTLRFYYGPADGEDLLHLVDRLGERKH